MHFSSIYTQSFSLPFFNRLISFSISAIPAKNPVSHSFYFFFRRGNQAIVAEYIQLLKRKFPWFLFFPFPFALFSLSLNLPPTKFRVLSLRNITVFFCEVIISTVQPFATWRIIKVFDLLIRRRGGKYLDEDPVLT